MEILGYFCALLIGVSLGLIGSGGSILTVPVLTYLLGISAVTATSYSLFIVGTSALVGAIRNFMKENVELKTGFVFAIPSLVAVWISRIYLLPAIPDPVFKLGEYMMTKDLAIMIFFSFIMILAAFSMLLKKNDFVDTVSVTERPVNNTTIIILEGFMVGMATGIVGAGGGFLIIPVLVILARIPMKMAIGTSLMIIAFKSMLGFTGDLLNPEISMDWPLLFLFSMLSVIGIFLGIQLTNFISGSQLKRGFGVFILVIGVYIMIERLSKM